MAVQRILLRRGTTADWSSVNPILAAGEPAYELPSTDYPLGRFKLGNGLLAWNDLPYFTSGGGGSTPGGGTPGGTGDASTVLGVTPSDVGLALLGAAGQSAGRNALGIDWSTLSGKPAVIGAGADAAAARSAIGALSDVEVGQRVDGLRQEVANNYADFNDLKPSRPFNPLTADYFIPQNSTSALGSGVKRTGLLANTGYLFRIELDYDVASAADLKFRLVGPAGATIRATAMGPLATSGNAGAWFGTDLTESNTSTMVVGGFSSTATATALGGSSARTTITGYIALGGTAGSLELYVAQGTAQPLMGAVKASTTFDIAECAA